MSVAMIRTTLTAGSMVRRQVRAAMDFYGISYVEHKGWFDSTFVIQGPKTQVIKLRNWMREHDPET